MPCFIKPCYLHPQCLSWFWQGSSAHTHSLRYTLGHRRNCPSPSRCWQSQWCGDPRPPLAGLRRSPPSAICWTCSGRPRISPAASCWGMCALWLRRLHAWEWWASQLTGGSTPFWPFRHRRDNQTAPSWGRRLQGVVHRTCCGICSSLYSVDTPSTTQHD